MSGEISVRLESCEAVIERGMQTFMEVGQALAEIRDSRLYREQFETFEDYCHQRWGLSRSRAYQMIDASDIAHAMSTIVDTPLPTNEGQARELSGLEPESAAEVMREAREQTGGRVTASAIREARNEIAPKPKPPITDLISSADLAALNAPRPMRPMPNGGPTCSMPEPDSRHNDAASDQSERDLGAALDAYVDADPEVQRARFAKRFADAMGRVVAVLQFDPESVAAVMDSDDWETVEDEFEAIAKFWKKLKSHRTQGLRLVGGTNV